MLSSHLVCYCFINVWFVISLLWYDVVRRLVTGFYLYEGNSYKQNRFDRSILSNYSRQYVEELKLHILYSLFYQICKLYIDLLYY